jgi:hypothetical protein
MFALGKVIYEASTGKDRLDFPALPSDVVTWPDKDAFMRLNEVLLRACANQPTRRYKGARELAQAFADAHGGKRPLPANVWRGKFLMPVGALVLVAAILSAFALSKSSCAARQLAHRPAPTQTNTINVVSAVSPVTPEGSSRRLTSDVKTAGADATAVSYSDSGGVSSNGIPTKTIVTEDAIHFLRP